MDLHHHSRHCHVGDPTKSAKLAAELNPSSSFSTTLIKKKKNPNNLKLTRIKNLSSLLKSHSASLRHLKQIHAHIVRSRLHTNTALSSILLSLLPSSSSLPLLSSIPSPPLPLFNSAIRRLSGPKTPTPFLLYLRLTRLNLRPDNFTFPFLLLSSPSLSSGLELHSRLTKSGFSSHLPVANSLLHFYTQFHSPPSFLLSLFHRLIPSPDLVSFNTLLSALSRLPHLSPLVSALFLSVPSPNSISFNALLLSLSTAGHLTAARYLFDRMPPALRNHASWSIMLIAYCNAALLDPARQMFDRMPHQNLICWSVMISGYSRAGRPDEALALFYNMDRASVVPDPPTMVGVISAAAQLGRSDLASSIDDYIVSNRIERNERVLTALADMHAKSGNVARALGLFNEIPKRDAFAYAALVNGLATHGHGRIALEVFGRMRAEGVAPDGITFIGVLSACSHTGLVDKGLGFWESMRRDYGIERGPDHYACVVDMLGRAGRLDEAFEMVEGMPEGPHGGALGALLAACKTYGNMEIAEAVAGRLFELEPYNSGNYILLSSIYAERERWGDAARVRKMMVGRGAQKIPASSWT